MAIVDLKLGRDFDLEQAWGTSKSAGLEKQSALEVVECWDMLTIWRDVIEERFGQIQSLRHRSPPDDPPDLEIVFADRTIPFEHSHLQPEHLGHFESLKHEVVPDQCVAVPSISNPPKGRKEMINAMLNVLDAPWSNVSDDHLVIKGLLSRTLRKKMDRLPNGGIIGIVDCVTLRDQKWLTEFAASLVNSDSFADSESFMLVLLYRPNQLQFYSAVIERGRSSEQRERW